MGSRPTLPIKVTITMDIMLKLIAPNFGDGLVVGTNEQDFMAHSHTLRRIPIPAWGIGLCP